MADGSIVVDVKLDSKELLNAIKQMASNAEKAAQDISKQFDSVVKAIDGMKKSFDSTKTAGASFLDVFTNAGSVITPIKNMVDIAKNAPAALANISSTWGKITTAIKGADITTKAYTLATSLASAAQSFFGTSAQAVGAALTPLTGGITASTAATWLWNLALAALPFVGIGLALMALVLGVGALCGAMNQQSEAEKQAQAEHETRMVSINQQAEAIKALTEEMDRNTESHQNNLDQINQSVEADMIKLENSKLLADELFRLADENGRVSDADQARAAVIMGMLNDALGTEYTMTGNQINQFSELESNIYKVIAAEEARVTVAAYGDILTEKIKNEVAAKDAASQATESLMASQGKLDSCVQRYIDQYKEQTGTTLDAATAMDQLANSQTKTGQNGENLATEYQNLCISMTDTQKVIENGAKAHEETEQARQNFVDKSTAFQEKRYKDVVASYELSEKERKAITSKSGTEIEAVIKDNNDKILALDKQKGKARSDEEAKSIQDQIDELKKKGKYLQDEYEKLGKGATDGMEKGLGKTDGVKDASGKVAEDSVDAGKDGLESHSPSKKTERELGLPFVQGFANGIKNNGSLAITAAVNMATAAYEAAKKALDINSPSRIMRDVVGAGVAEGLAVGIKKNTSEAEKASRGMAEDTLNATMDELGINSPSTELRDKVGIQIPAGVAEGIDGNTRVATKASAEMSYETLLAAEDEVKLFKSEIGKEIPKEVGEGIAENSKEMTDKFKKALEALDAQRKVDIVNDEEYYAELTRLRDKYLTKGTKEWLDYSNKILDYKIKELAEKKKLSEEETKLLISQVNKVEKAYEGMYNFAKGKMEALASEQANAAKKFMNMGDLIEKYQFRGLDGEMKTHISLADFSDDTASINKYNNSLKTVRGKLEGLDKLSPEQIKSFYAQFSSMSMEEGQQFADLLNNADSDTFAKYIDGWTAKEQAALDLAKTLTVDKSEEVLKAINENTEDGLENLKKEIPDGFTELGVLSGEKFGDAFVEAMNNLLAKIDEETDGKLSILQGTEEGELEMPVVRVVQAVKTEQGEVLADPGQYQAQYHETVDEAVGYAAKKLNALGLAIPEGFFKSGIQSAKGFGEAFISELEYQLARAAERVASFAANAGAVFGPVGSGMNTYNNSYVFNGSGQTVSQQLRAARAHNDLERMRFA